MIVVNIFSQNTKSLQNGNFEIIGQIEDVIAICINLLKLDRKFVDKIKNNLQKKKIKPSFSRKFIFYFFFVFFIDYISI